MALFPRHVWASSMLAGKKLSAPLECAATLQNRIYRWIYRITGGKLPVCFWSCWFWWRQFKLLFSTAYILFSYINAFPQMQSELGDAMPSCYCWKQYSFNCISTEPVLLIWSYMSLRWQPVCWEDGFCCSCSCSGVRATTCLCGLQQHFPISYTNFCLCVFCLPNDIFCVVIKSVIEECSCIFFLFFFSMPCFVPPQLIFFWGCVCPQVIKAGVETTCKCHGVSGSCTVRTCWRQLSPFHEIGKQLKQKYETSLKVGSTTNEATGEGDISPPKKSIPGHSDQIPRTTDLVYIDDSPSFCLMSRYSPGTSGRKCYKDKNCDSICCGRGHNTQSRVVTRPCQCQVRWCCYVECKQCTQREEVYTCKD